MMLHRPVQRPRVPRQNTDAVITPPPTPITVSVLDAHRHRQFAQHLAVLIERVRAANREGIVDER